MTKDLPEYGTLAYCASKFVDYPPMTDQFPDATKKVLSHAAQAVLDAYWQTSLEAGVHRPLAAALRAAADQVVPVPINAQTSEGHWALLGVKNRLLAIADELESQQ
jgi:hypothetical protein